MSGCETSVEALVSNIQFDIAANSPESRFARLPPFPRRGLPMTPGNAETMTVRIVRAESSVPLLPVARERGRTAMHCPGKTARVPPRRRAAMSQSRREQLEAMLAETPDDAELHYFLAMDYLSAGDHDTALRLFEELMAKAPDYVPTYVQAGQLYNRLDRVAQARATYQAGIAAAHKKGDFHAAGEMEGFLDAL
jgi:tetratricopeptide (TPR) repeat protein